MGKKNWIRVTLQKGRKETFFERLTMLNGEALQVEVDALVFENQWIAFTYGLFLSWTLCNLRACP
ncbi:hypothetical protein OL548_32015 [Lysinibacillus sp. MHQ-1]|nr:hypothetical protein OL548_32015 [Lysinibacillus sp. MHQ-1]